MGGSFTRATDVDGRVVTRSRLAAVDAASGALLAWNPGADKTVYAIAVSGATVYLGGDFTRVGGVARTRQAAFSLSSGALDGGWRPSADGPIHALRVGFSGTRVYVAGLFTRLGGDPAHAYAGAVDTAGAAKFPTLEIDGGGQAIAVIGPEVYLGGHFDNICPGGIHQDGAGRSVCTGAGTSRHKLLSVDAASGRPTAWNPSANSALGVFALAPVPGGPLVAGGDFTQAAGAANRHLALFG